MNKYKLMRPQTGVCVCYNWKEFIQMYVIIKNGHFELEDIYDVLYC